MYIKCTWIITHTHTYIHTCTHMLTYTVYPTHVRVLTCAHLHLSTVQSSKKDKKGVKEVKKPADTKQKGKEKEKVSSVDIGVQYLHHATCMKQMLCTHIYTHMQTHISTCMHRYTHSYTDVLSTKVGPASSGKAKPVAPKKSKGVAFHPGRGGNDSVCLLSLCSKHQRQ